MGSVPVQLHEEPYVAGHVHAYVGLPAPLEPGGEGYTGVGDISVWPSFVVRQRTRTGFTEEGAPVFAWSDVLTGETMLYTQRREVDAEAGVTTVIAKATVNNNAGLLTLHESASAVDSDGHAWRVTASEVFPTHVVLSLDRVEYADDGEALVAGPEPYVPLDLVLPAEPLAFSYGGELRARTGVSNVPLAGGTFTVASVAAALDVAPAGGATVVDVLVNGSSIFTDPGARPTFAAGSVSAVVGEWAELTLADGDVVSVNVVSVAPGFSGSDMVLAVRLHRET